MEDIRHIENPFLKIFNIVNADHTQLYSLLLKLLSEFFRDVKLPTLICQKSKPSQSEEDVTAYTGTAGYLTMLLRLYHYFKNKSQEKSEMFASKAHIVGDEQSNKFSDPNFYLKTAENQYKLLEQHILSQKQDDGCYSYYMSNISVWANGMHIGFIKKNHNMFKQNQARIIQSFRTLTKNLKSTQWELLYGVPGFLYALLQLQKRYDANEFEIYQTNFRTQTMELTHIIINEGIKNYEKYNKSKVDFNHLRPDFRLIYYFAQSEYLGAAHGLGGILNVLLISMKLNRFKDDTNRMIQVIRGSIAFLLKFHINGNFTPMTNSKSVKLVHFCHGASGIVTTLCKFMDMYPELGIQMGLKEVIEANLNHIWKYGVLKKGFGLCHGISGNAYAFISPSVQAVFHDRVKQFLKKAQLLALLHEQEGVMKEISEYGFQDRLVCGRSDEPYSLMLGIAGDICFTIDVLKGVGLFPGYDL